MIFSINQSELLNILNAVQKGIATHSSQPILSGIYLRAEDNETTFQSTDLELSVRCTTTALVEEEGSVVVPGKLIVDIVKNLPDAAIRIQAHNETVTITCNTSTFSIKGLNPDDFPTFPVVATERQVNIPFELFSSMAKQTNFATSRDESRKILTGVLIKVENSVLNLVATDSYRLALVKKALTHTPDDFEAVISGGFISSLASLQKTGEDMAFGLADNQIVVTYHDMVFINRRIEGKYPNYKQLLPDTSQTRVLVNKDILTAAVKRVALIGQMGSSIKFDLNKDSQTIQLSSVIADVGSTEEIIPAKISGENIQIAFNSNYVIDGLNAISTDSVLLEFQSSMKPGIMRNSESDDYTYLIMPVRLT